MLPIARDLVTMITFSFAVVNGPMPPSTPIIAPFKRGLWPSRESETVIHEFRGYAGDRARASDYRIVNPHGCGMALTVH